MESQLLMTHQLFCQNHQKESKQKLHTPQDVYFITLFLVKLNIWRENKEEKRRKGFKVSNNIYLPLLGIKLYSADKTCYYIVDE